MASYRDINYALRPAKNIERKMLLEAFRRLTFIGDLKDYRYIGLGSTYFSDFELFHKELNITNLLSIEGDKGSAPRFEFNRPYSCVKLKFDFTYEVLPSLSYEQKDIVWLDYDGGLQPYILDDIDTIISNVQMGSMFLFSMNVNTPKVTLCDDEKKDPLKRKVKEISCLEEINRVLFDSLNIEKELDPRERKKSVFEEWNFSKKCREIITQQIEKVVKNREDSERKGIKYRQLFNFHYADGAKMLTVGGIIYNDALADTIELCNFENLSFVRTHEEALLIEVPNLTYREIKYLKKYMSIEDIDKFPKDVSGKKIDTIIPQTEIKQFQRVYRYFPTFSETGM